MSKISSFDQELPVGIDLAHLRMLAGVCPEWDIDIAVADLAQPACLHTSMETHKAVIVLSSSYLFPPKALARAVMHELLELFLIDLWHLDQAIIGKLSATDQLLWTNRVREARDAIIEDRIRQMPYWNVYDIPIPKEALGVHYV